MRLRFILGRVFSGLGHNMAMTISVVLVTFISLLFVGVGGLAQMQVAAMQKEWYAKVEVSVYMCAQDDQVANCNGQAATKRQIQDVKDELDRGTLSQYVDHYEFQNHHQVYADFQKQYGDTTLGEATKPEMLPQAFRIKMKDPSQYEIVSAQLSGQPGVEQVQDQSQLVKPLMNLFSQAMRISWGLAGVMAIAAILLIVTTIRLSAMSRQKETEIMRMEGASGLFIQLPFMIEGALCALFGALLACGALFAGVKYLVQGWLQKTIPFIQFVNLREVAILSGMIIAAALILSIVASIASLAKYAKV